ncbi:unnamed protein product [Moneuplotes crassus]|uniref:Uncharacterized protein n=1 Tax=Euplotes crassus TaxID=5936 RepID=A0AAD1X956_EUPCR|nr:unnamed protein product [Moneuplotes crassus]
MQTSPLYYDNVFADLACYFNGDNNDFSNFPMLTSKDSIKSLRNDFYQNNKENCKTAVVSPILPSCGSEFFTTSLRNTKILPTNPRITQQAEIRSSTMTLLFKDNEQNELTREFSDKKEKKVSILPKKSSPKQKKSPKMRGRLDIKKKKALRDVRKFYKDSFKSKNVEIMKQRYINCSFEMIFEGTQWTLMDAIPQEFVTDELVYYTIGILGIKKLSEINCSNKLKNEISQYFEAVRRFTLRSFNFTIKSDNFVTLCRFLPQNKEQTTRMISDASEKSSSKR